jgi:hypothetical protein
MKKNDSKMLSLPKLCQHDMDQVDATLSKSKKQDTKMRVKYAMKFLAIDKRDDAPDED